MKKIILLSGFLLGAFFAKADPGWTVNPGSYQYSMTFTSVANVRCVELANANHKIAAFVGGVCRGVAQTSVVSGGRNYAFLVIYSNLSSGETVDFKIYNSVLDSVYSGLDSTAFVSSSIVGSVSNPAVVYTNHAPTNILLSFDSIAENLPVASLVGGLSAIDADAGDVHSFSLTAGLLDNDKFAIAGLNLVSDTMFNYEITPSYMIEIKTDDGHGCVYSKQFSIGIINVFENPDSLLLSNTTVPENEPSRTFIGTFSTIADPDTMNVYTYTFHAGVGDAHNSYFFISHDSLFNDSVLNFENIVNYSILIRATGIYGDSLTVGFVINATDVNEKPYLTAAEYEISEDAAVDTEIGQIAWTDVDAGQSYKHYLVTTGTPFAVDSMTGKILVAGSMDYETTKEYDITVALMDNGVPALYDTTVLKVIINDAVEEGLFPSTDFVSPNDDGKNDFWMITNVFLYSAYSLNIMDEFGQKVYSVESGYNNEWDAKRNGVALPNGSYYYVFQNSEVGKLFKGVITVAK